MGHRLKPLDRQVIVLTGASSGIGLATARMAAERGAALVLASRNEDALRELANEINGSGGRATYVVTDVSRLDEIENLAAEAQRQFGGFDSWINNAAVAVYGPLEKIPIEDQRQLFEINYWGVVYGSLTALRHLRHKGGAIINVGSLLSDMPMPLQGAYAAAKHAIKGFTNSLRIELEHDRVPVSLTLIKPSSIDTPYSEHARSYLERIPIVPPPVYVPRTVAHAILHACEHPIRELVVGAGGRMQIALHNMWAGLSERVLARLAYGLQQTSREGIPARRDNLYESRADGAERSSYRRMVIPASPFTQAQLHPVIAAGAATAVGLAVIAALRPRLLGRGVRAITRRA